MSYRNIDSILRGHRESPVITGSGTTIANMSELPENGEEVYVETTFGESLRVEVQTLIDGGNICQGVAKHDIYQGDIGAMELIIDNGELIEFSRSKIYSIHRMLT